MSPQELWASKYAARFAEERAREDARREEAFLDLPKSLCGEEVRQITPMDLLVLNGVGNAFVAGGNPEPEDVAIFLWWMNVQNDKSDTWSNERRKKKMIRRVGALPLLESCKDIVAFVEAAFQDAPNEGGKSEGRGVSTCFITPLVLSVACETGWDEQDILNKPLARLFQYTKSIRARKMGDAFIDIAPSDRLTSEFLSELSQGA